MLHRNLSITAMAAVFLSAPAMAAEPVSVTLDWTPNTNFVGLYVAQALGFYDEAGLDVRIAPFEFGQPRGDIAAFGVLDFYTAKAAGLDAVGVYAVIQTETGRLAYSGADISGPRDLAGGTYGGFGTNWEKAIIDTMIAHDGGSPHYAAVTLDGSVYDALRAGEIDFTLDVLTWQGVENELAGHAIGSFRYADYGVPDQHTIVLAADGAFLAQRAETTQAFVTATQQGYAYAVAHPREAAEMLLAAAPELAGQAALVDASMQVMIAGNYLMREDGTIGRFDPGLMTELGDFLFAAGALVGPDGAPLADRPDFAGWYTNRYLD
jgi:ABC-type nitrate/sulfonate/bicarbonate transport system substrate-binding protein